MISAGKQLSSLVTAAAVLILVTGAEAVEKQPLELNVSGLGIDLSSLDVGVSALGLLYALEEEDAPDDAEARRQFDLAANLDLTWDLDQQFEFGIQLQMGPGGGTMGLVGPAVELTDYFITWRDKEKLILTMGSFDLPFGETTGRLTNNGDASANSLLLNSLMYEALAGPMGTLNVIGFKQTSRTDYFDVTTSLVNGTDEAAVNPDGNFGASLRLTGHDKERRINLSGSVVYSDDYENGHAAGVAAEWFGWLGELYLLYPSFEAGGYYGLMNFNNTDTGADDIAVAVWMGELVYRFDRAHVAVRASGWMPDTDGDALQLDYLETCSPGLAQGEFVTDGELIRYQAGLGYSFTKHGMVRADVFYDDYMDEVLDEFSTDVIGAMIGVQVTR
ncbi:hypothetical protein GF324_09800 [bacterium]|nr:hypothetical protein [bacterium]